MQNRKYGAWKIGRWFFIAILVVYSTLALLSTYIFPTRYADCERDTKELNGGERTYAGQKFRIILCGTGGDENFMGDKIRMQIFSAEGSLLAQRKFHVNWDGVEMFELSYGDNYLIYIDKDHPNDYKRKVTMPPTWLDWIRARLPLVD